MAQIKKLNSEQETGSFSDHLLSFCDICCAHLPSPPPFKQNLSVQLAGSISGGCVTENNVDLINEQLLLYFIAKKLLKFEDEQFLDLLLRFDGEEKVGRSDNSLYFRNFCVNCEEIITEAMEAHKNVIKLQKQIFKLGEQLRNSIKWNADKSNEKDFRENKIGKKIRALIYQEFDNRTGLFKNRVDDLISGPTFQNVKVETEYVLNDHDEVESNDGLFNDMVSWDGNSNDHFDAWELKQNVDTTKENTTSTWKENFTVKDQEDEADQCTDSSDYNPDKELLFSKSTKKNFKVKPIVGSTKRSKNLISHKKGKKVSNCKGQSSYTCNLCNMVHNTAHGFRNHLKAHEESTKVHGNRYDCPKCNFPALSERKLRYHLTIAHEETHKNTCSICGFVGSRRWIYDKHMLEKHNIQVWTPIDKESESSQTDNQTTPFTSSYVEPENLSDNVNNETDDNTSRESQSDHNSFCCEKCKTVYKTRAYFQRHQEAHKLSEKLDHKYDCEECGFPANSEKFLRYHKIKEHKKYLMRTCTLCGHQVKRLDQMKLHMKNHHSQSGSGTSTTKVGRKRKLEEKHATRASSSTCNELNIPHENSAHVSNETDCTLKKENSENEKNFHCEKCKAVYKTRISLQRHHEAHELSEKLDHKFDCDECGFPANSERFLRYHKIKDHKQYLMRTCHLCGHQVKRLDQMKLHMKNKHSQTGSATKGRKRRLGETKTIGRFKCNLCGYNYANPGALKRHMGDHAKSDELDKKWECSSCGFPCLSEQRLHRHVQIKHEKDPLTCSICQRSFGRRYLLKAHLLKHKQFDKTLDPTTGLFCCDLCPNKYNSLEGVILHKALGHPEANNCLSTGGVGEDSHLCQQCGRCYTTSLQLRRHIKIRHEGYSTHTCEVCGKGINGKIKLAEHMKTHEKNRVKEFVCEICGSAYTAKDTLTKHVKKYHPKGDVLSVKHGLASKRVYSCKFCTEIFPLKLLFEKHLESVHNDMYTFQCNLCDKSYISASSLRLHKEINHGEGGGGTHSCEYCGKQFTHKHYVVCHYKWCPVKRKQKIKQEGS